MFFCVASNMSLASEVEKNEDNVRSTLFQLIDHIDGVNCSEPNSIPRLHDYFFMLKQVIVALGVDSAKILMHPFVQSKLFSLHKARAHYEYHSELLDAAALIDSPEREILVQQYAQKHFPHTAIHSNVLSQLIDGCSECLVIGSGALPSTVMLLGESTRLEITAIDRCDESVRLSKKILDIWSVVNRGKPISVKVADVLSVTNFDSWDCLFLNALVGVGEHCSKNVVLEHILQYCEPGKVLLLRTPHMVGQWVYPSVDTALFEGLSVTYIPPPVVDRSGLLVVRL
jgi:hypothetical protein